jgi:threonine dehydrogenase-like Zn-dependent dehydrogenase
VVVDIDNERLDYARKVLPVEEAKELGVELMYINTSEVDNPKEALMAFTDGNGYDDVFVYAPVKPVIELSDDILGYDGCLNFFAGPMDTEFKASFNFYNVHYNATHIAGTSGGSTEDMQECLDMSAKGLVNPALMVSHVGGLQDVPNAICDLPNMAGNKKLIYPHIDMPLVDIRYLRDIEDQDARYGELADILDKSKGIWSLEAEQYVLAKF